MEYYFSKTVMKARAGETGRRLFGIQNKCLLLLLVHLPRKKSKVGDKVGFKTEKLS